MSISARVLLALLFPITASCLSEPAATPPRASATRPLGPGASEPRPEPEASQAAPDAPPVEGLVAVQAVGGVLLGSGRPTPEDLEALRAAGVRTVLDLRSPEEQRGFDEPTAVHALGMAYVRLDSPGADPPSDEVFARARELLGDAALQPLFVHAGSGDLVGAVWLAHRVLDAGLAWDEALAEAGAVGLESPALAARARQYVEAQGDE